MKEVNSERIAVDLDAIRQKYSKNELATICAEITGKLCSKAEELSELFMSLKRVYPDLIAVCDFSLICVVTASPFQESPFQTLLGTNEGIGKAAQEIIKALQEVAHDKETA